MTDTPDHAATLAGLADALRAALALPRRIEPPPLPPTPEEVTHLFAGLNAEDAVYRSAELDLTVKIKTIRRHVLAERIVYEAQASICDPDTAKARLHASGPRGRHIFAAHQLVVQNGCKVDVEAELRALHARLVAEAEWHEHHDRQHAALTVPAACALARAGAGRAARFSATAPEGTLHAIPVKS